LNHPDLSFEGIHQAVVRGMKKGQDKYPIAVGILGIVDRNLTPTEASIVSDFITSNTKSIVGMDLANDELLFDSKPFAEHFKLAKRSGLHITVHAGESLVDNKYAENVKEAIDLLGAERIGHGIAISLNDNVLNYVNKHNVVLEVCPSR
jgi:adenosine deaminase